MAGMRSESATPVPQSSDGESAGLHWTGHPLVDHGIATLVAFAGAEREGVSRPEDVTATDLEAFAVFAEHALSTKAVQSHASVIFTINVPYLQPSHPAAKKAANARWLFRVRDSDSVPGQEKCPYCGRPSVSVRAVAKSDRLYRELVPLLTGQDVINFAPAGDHGLSLCGRCIVSLQALIVGAPSCEGRALVVQADDPALLVDLVRTWLPEIRKRVELSAATGDKVETWKAPRTRLIEQLVTLGRASELIGPLA
jgi:CRISPR-associated protein Cst1